MPYFIQNRLSACLFPSTLDERLPIAKGRNAVIQHINKNSPLPIYYQIESALKQQIESGVLQPGDLIPSEREFAEAHQISRMTVRQAISNLVNAGYLIRQKGRGTFVANKKIVMQLSGLTSFSEEMEHLGLEPTSALLSYQIIDASMTIANKLRIREGASYVLLMSKLLLLRPSTSQSNSCLDSIKTSRPHHSMHLLKRVD